MSDYQDRLPDDDSAEYGDPIYDEYADELPADDLPASEPNFPDVTPSSPALGRGADAPPAVRPMGSMPPATGPVGAPQQNQPTAPRPPMGGAPSSPSSPRPGAPAGTSPLGGPSSPQPPAQRPNLPGTGVAGGSQPPAPSQSRPNLPGAQPPAQARPNLPGSHPSQQPGQQGPQLPGQSPRPAAPPQPGGQPPAARPNLPGSGTAGGSQPSSALGQPPTGAPPRPAQTGLPGGSPPTARPGGLPGQTSPSTPTPQSSAPAQARPAPAPGAPPAAAPGAGPRPAMPTGPAPIPPKPAQPAQQASSAPAVPHSAPGRAGSPAKPGSRSPTKPGVGSPTKPGSRSPTKPGGGSPTKPGSGSPTAPARKSSAASARRELPGVEHTIRQRVASNGDEADTDIFTRIQRMMPSFSDEVAALALIGVGLLSFFTLVSPSSGALGTAWGATLRQIFGVGAYVVSAVILGAGTLILVPKLGVEVRLNWWRIIAGEGLFMAALGFIHLWTRVGYSADLAREEAIAAALEGRGGGYLGWAVQEALNAVLGDLIAGLLLIGLMLIFAGIAFGVSRHHLIQWLEKARSRLMAFVWRMEGRRPVQLTATDEATPAGTIQPVTAESAEALPLTGDGMAEVNVAGRPSIVTGEAAAGPSTVLRPVPALTRTSPVRLSLRHEDDKPQREINYRFTLHETPDRKKIKKRSPELPPLELLDVTDYMRPTEDEININAEIIEETVREFGMTVQVIGVKSGPTVTQYAVQPFSEVDQDGQTVVVQRVRVTRVAALAQDLSLSLSAPRVRIQAPVPGTNYIGVEVPNTRPGIVSLRPVIESERFFKIKSPLAIALGREVDGKAFTADLATMPHMLIGGTTGSGKSVCLASITTCLVANNKPDELRLIMIDPKMVELIRFNGLPHLYGKVEVELERIIGVLRWVTREMDRRYKLMEEAQARNIIVYNEKQRKKKDRLPYIVVLIDELAELMTEYPDETEHLLTRLAQMARATGIHLVVATQRPSTEVVTGLIKANFPARISFAVASGIDSRVIIDSVGAEELIGRGDMLFYASDAAGPIRLQGCFASDAEMERVVEYWRGNWEWDEAEAAPWERSLTRTQILDETDQMLEEAIKLIQKEGEASASLLQRKLNMSYPRAGRLIDSLYKIGVVGEPMAGGKSRRVLISPNVDPTNYIVTWRSTHTS